MTDQKATFYIKHFNLQAHPEGGFYSEIYRSPETISATALPNRFNGDRSFATSIYFLLKRGQVSKFHRIAADETWHFYDGGEVLIHMITEDGRYEIRKLGSQIHEGQTFQLTVPQGVWFGASLAKETSFALVGCTVSPGFDFRDFELATQGDLIKHYPQHHGIIEKLT